MCLWICTFFAICFLQINHCKFNSVEFKMIHDESFPADELFDKLTPTPARHGSLQRQTGINLELPEFEPISFNESAYLNSDCSEESCASDPVGLEHDHNNHEKDKNVSGDNDKIGNQHSHINAQLGIAGSSKAVSYQDIHSAYTKRRYKHVTSKVRKYIAELNGRKQPQGSASKSFQRHRSMPDSLTPRGHNAEEDQRNLDEEFLSTANSSGTNTINFTNESYERLMLEIESLKSHNNYLYSLYQEKIEKYLLLRNSFDSIRDEFTAFKDKAKRQSSVDSSLHTLGYYPTTTSALTDANDRSNDQSEIQIERVAKATQTDLALIQGQISNLSDLSDMPIIAANATPHPNANLNDITYDSSAGSIEIPLLSVRPPVCHIELKKSSIKPFSLNFSNDSAEVDTNGNAVSIVNGDAENNNSQPNRIATNNSGSSDPSSNDSAIEVEGHELRSQQQLGYRGQTFNFRPVGEWNQRRDLLKICVNISTSITVNGDAENNNSQPNRIATNNSGSSNSSDLSSNNNTTTNSNLPYSANMAQRKKSMAQRMLSLFGPCARCDDPNQTVDTTNDSYTVGIPLLGNESNRD